MENRIYTESDPQNTRKIKELIKMRKTVHRLSRSYSVSYQQVINSLGINYVKRVNKCGIICGQRIKKTVKSTDYKMLWRWISYPQEDGREK